MSTSLPSKPIVAVDLPEVNITSAEFVYNFYVPDESVNDRATMAVSHGTSGVIDENVQINDAFLSRISRFVRVDFKPVGRLFELGEQEAFFEDPNKLDSALLRDNVDKITYEHDLSNYAFTGLGFQDSGIDKKLFELLSGSLAMRLHGIMNPPSIPVPAPELNDSEVSLLEFAKFLNDVSDNEARNMITDAMVNYDESGLLFINNRTTTRSDVFEQIKRLNMQVQLNNGLIYDIIRNVINDPMTIYGDELLPIVEKTRALQLEAKDTVNQTFVDMGEYDSLISFIRLFRNDEMSFKHYREIVGYIVDKHEIMPNGSVTAHESFIVENPNAAHTYDPNVRYGARYMYTIRTIAKVTFEAHDISDQSEAPALYVIESLISSKPSRKVTVDCVENVPPPPPTDFRVSWDYGVNKPRLTWNFPINRQRDVTRFQVFRRASIDEPFELVRMIDFDKSSLKDDGRETVDQMLVDVTDGPRTMYIDHDFDRYSTFIYAVCSVDAHGMSSNYSSQIAVSFNQFKNKIVTRSISISGAPKPLPNLHLDSDVFIDTIKTSGHDYVKIYFDPEFLSIFMKKPASTNDTVDIANNLTEIPFLSTDQDGGTYRLQIINLDVQKQRSLEITLADKRT